MAILHTVTNHMLVLLKVLLIISVTLTFCNLCSESNSFLNNKTLGILFIFQLLNIPAYGK